MKKCIIIAFISFLLVFGTTSCADSKTFKRQDGTSFTAEPYGWIDKESKKIKGVWYEVCAGNIVWSIIGCETIFIPVLLTGFGMYEPVSYTEMVCDGKIDYIK